MPESVPMIFMGNDPRILNLVKSGDAPLGIVASDECYDSFESEAILYDELVVAVAPAHPWAQQHIGPGDLSKGAFISREKGSMIRALVERKLEEVDENISLNVQMELGSITAIKRVVEEGWAFSIFSRADLQKKLKAGSMVEVKGFSIPCSFKLIRQPSATLNLAEQRFYEFLLKMHKLGSGSPAFKTPEPGAEHSLTSS
jgi:DNA-binding transcriptional LysR family regulator